MTTNTSSKKFLAALATVISAAGLMLTLSTTTFASADSVGSSATVGTVPTCVWQLSGVTDSVPLNHPNVAGGGDSHTAYVGKDFMLTGSSAKKVSIYVGPLGQLSASTTDVDNCSFYNDGGLGVSNAGAKAQIEMTDETPRFTAVHVTADAAMTFALDGVIPTGSAKARNLSLTITPTQCVNTNVGTGSDDSWAKESGTTGLNKGSSPVALASLAKAATTTTSTCSFSSAFVVYIPGGLTPRDHGQEYTFTGPTLTTTLASVA